MLVKVVMFLYKRASFCASENDAYSARRGVDEKFQ